MTQVTNHTDFVIMGAAPDTANLGVSALCYAILMATAHRLPQRNLLVFDFGRGLRQDVIASSNGNIHYRKYGSLNTRRFYHRESIFNMSVSATFGGLGHPAVHAIQQASAVLDVSGGDSFSDIYGDRIFHSIALRKEVVLRLDSQLVLLPQTYGPFTRPRNRRRAENIVRNAAMAWARDPRSFEALRELLGDAFDPERHRCGVDVAFGLEVQQPQEQQLVTIQDWLDSRHADRPLVGLNVSGLIYNDTDNAARQYRLKANYRTVIHDLVRRLITQSNARVLLVPHVVVAPPATESDIAACQAVVDTLPEFNREQLRVAPTFHDPREVKWLISECDWFCGTRMHSTIAALSTGVPTAAIAYSPKTQGVFETCDQGDRVADPRQLESGDMVDHLWQSWLNRAEAKARLDAALPTVRRQAEKQMDEIVQLINEQNCL